MTTTPTSTPNPAAKPNTNPAKAARAELVGKYRAVFNAAWAKRHELAGPKLMAHEAAFLPPSLSLQATPTHPAPRRLAWAIMGLMTLTTVWACLGKIDIVAVAQGRVVVSQRSKTIQPLERAVVQRIWVVEGQHVKAGDPLVDLDPTMANADSQSLSDQIKANASDLMRSRAMLNALQLMGSGSAASTNAPPKLADKLPALPSPLQLPANWTSTDQQAAQAQLANEWADAAARLHTFAAQIEHRQAEIRTARAVLDKINQSLPLVRQREADMLSLSEQGLVAQHTSQDRTRERIELERDLTAQQARIQEAQAAIAEAQRTRNSWLAEARVTHNDRLTQATTKLQQATQEHAKAQRRQTLATLAAPVDGVVQQLAVHTTGGVVTEAQPLMVIVPSSQTASVDVVLQNKDIGFVNVGQAAQIKFETFPYTRYGTIEAKVQTVSADAVLNPSLGTSADGQTTASGPQASMAASNAQAHTLGTPAGFVATLQLQNNEMNIDGKRIRIGPGMNITAEIKTGQRTLIEYLLSPIERAVSEGMRER